MAAAIAAAATVPTPSPVTFPAAPLPGGPAGQVVLAWAPQDAPASVNRTDGWHWAQLHAYRQQWQGEAAAAARAAAADLAPFAGHRVEVTVAVPVPDRRRRDAHNYVASVVKPIVDGLVRTGLLAPDDTPDWMAVTEPLLYVGEQVRVRVRTAPTAEDPSLW